jgi:hypothetical protein
MGANPGRIFLFLAFTLFPPSHGRIEDTKKSEEEKKSKEFTISTFLRRVEREENG